MSDTAEIYTNVGGEAVEPDDIRAFDATGDGVEAYVRVDGEARRFWPRFVTIDDFEYDTSTMHSRHTVSGTTGQVGTEAVGHAVEGDRVAFVARNTGTASFWSVPSHDTLPVYPEPGDRFVYHVRIHEEASGQTWALFGGTSDDGSGATSNGQYEVRLIQDPTGDDNLQISCRPDGTSSPFTVASSQSTHGTGRRPNFNTGTWYSVLVDWFDADLDGRTGVRARIYNTTMPDPDSDSIITWGSADTADYPHNPDGSGDIPQAAGRIGARDSRGTAAFTQWDQFVRYPPRQ